ncbi:MFS general substrate transporter [Lophiostoma macrostomum CBS 122681]|uniref:MFS general substrate transporter n=1 Tax=Lophiostoma macrostomum CBS 122681 TaxID=1314788 RepID=A0A6A6T1G5_9PLEO|nr:MFS general substrate transporter [Lophiostoma macrostomum CBS 122681]
MSQTRSPNRSNLPRPPSPKILEDADVEKDPSHAELRLFEPPDGGFRAWACVAGCFLLQFCGFGYINACGLFQYHYSAVLLPDQSSSSLAWITTLQICLLFLFGPAVGQLIDVYGARKVTVPFSVLAILCVCMLSLCTEYWQIMLAQGVGFGIAAAGLSLPALVLANQWFSSHRGLATGIVAAGSSFGGVIYPLFIPNLIDRVGFAAAVRWTALMQGILLVIANLLVATPFPPKGIQKKGGMDMAALKTPVWIFLLTGLFFCMWGLFAPLNYLPEFAADHGINYKLAQYTISVANAGSMLGRIIPGYVADRLGHFNMLVAGSLLSALLVLVFWIPLEYHSSLGGIYAFALLYGFASGGFVSLGPTCVVTLNKGMVEQLGAQLGGFCLAVALGSLSGLPIASSIGGWLGLMGFAGASLFVASPPSPPSRPTQPPKLLCAV